MDPFDEDFSTLSRNKSNFLTSGIMLSFQKTIAEEVDLKQGPLEDDMSRLDKILDTFRYLRRKKQKYDSVLNLFKNKKNNKSVKKNNFLTNVIRSHQTLNRNVPKNKCPKNCMVDFEACKEKFQQIQSYHNMQEFRNTKSMPFAMNDRLSYFNIPGMIENWKLFINLVFDKCSPDELYNKFSIACCNGTHNSCERKWKALKYYLRTYVLESLNLNSKVNHLSMALTAISDSEVPKDIFDVYEKEQQNEIKKFNFFKQENYVSHLHQL